VLLYAGLYAKNTEGRDHADELIHTWDLYGKIESFKGTFMHKKIELFINALVIPMEKNGNA
jgi:hypothetical protein